MSTHLDVLRGLRQKPNEFAVIDIETMNWTKFLCIGYYDGKTYHETRSLKSFLKFLSSTSKTTIFAHFGGKFDFLFILEECFKQKVKINSIIPRGSSILSMEIILNKKSFFFRDSSALLPFSLKSITENFDTQHKKQDWDHTKTKGYSKKLSEYLRLDCISLYESIEKFYEWPLIKKSGPAYTIAGQALRVFRTFLKNELYNPGQFANEYSRPAYLGGRTEIFKPLCEKGPLYEYDVNSLYPFVMKSNLYPCGKASMVYQFEKHSLGIYECFIDAPILKIPVLGILHDKKYIFPTGTFKGVFTTPEINYAKSMGYKIKIKRGIVFQEKQNLFEEYINNLYSIRLLSQKNSVNDILAKLLMNSLYGRFGINPNKENITFELEEGVKEFRELKVNNKTIMLYKKPVTLNSFQNTAIAAFVTSYARIHMNKIMQKNPESIFYTDTDSIFTTEKHETGKNLGDLKLENTHDSAVFLLPKTYIAISPGKKKIAMKGFDRKKVDHFDLDDFKNALEGDLSRFKIVNAPKFASLKQSLSKKKIVSMTKQSEKQLKALYNKRIIFKKNNSFDTHAIHLTLGE